MDETIKKIVLEYLKKTGADGLCYKNCGCGLDDLMPCYEVNQNCEIAKRIEKGKHERCKDCNEDCDDFCFIPIKEA